MNEQQDAPVGSGTAAAAWPPAGFVDRLGAAAVLGVVGLTLKRYTDEGKVPAGRMSRNPAGRPALLYAIADLERAKAEMAAAAAAAADRPHLPEGYVDHRSALRLFGVGMKMWAAWTREGRVPASEWGRTRTGAPCRIYALAELELAREAMRADPPARRERKRPAGIDPPPGLVRRRAAARMLGISYDVFRRWEREGLLPCAPDPSGPGAGVPGALYRVADLQRVAAEYGRLGPPYPDPDRPGVWRVPLGGHDVRRREAIIDEADVPLVRGRHCHFSDRGPGREANGQVAIRWDGGEARPLRQVIMGVCGRECRVGHRNGDPLDCRRENLIVRTRRQILRGAPKRKAHAGRPCSSRFKGVSLNRRVGRWVAGIKDGERCIHLGYFRDELDAAMAYDEAARERFGEQARLNFPDGVDAWLEQETAPDVPQRAAA